MLWTLVDEKISEQDGKAPSRKRKSNEIHASEEGRLQYER